MSRLAYLGLLFVVVLSGLGIGWAISSSPQIAAGRASAATPSDDSLRPILQARYDAMKAAMATHDGHAMSSILAPDFTSVDVSGQSETGAQMIAEVDGLKHDASKVSTTTLMAISVEANRAIVQQRYDMKTAEIGDDGARHSIELIARSTDTWIKSGDTWLLERTLTDELSSFKDGDLVAHR